MKILVQKYGGTSVGSIERIAAVAERVKAEIAKDPKVRMAVVVSAMSGETNRLVELVRMVNPDASPVHYDMAVASGEQVSCALLAAALEKIGIKAQPFLGHQLGIQTDSSHSMARIKYVQKEPLERCWRSGAVAVVAGFQGVGPNKQITTLGRGGSDTTAVALAAAIKANACEIYTDVDGFYTADPRIVKAARSIPIMDYETALEMASLGSKVLHSRCVEIAAKYKLDLYVKNSFIQDSIGTKIMQLSEKEGLESPVVSGVASVTKVAKISVRKLPIDPKLMSHIFQSVADAGVNIDVIVHDLSSEDNVMRVGFSLSESDIDKTKKTLEEALKAADLKDVIVNCEDGFAKVSVVGLGMRSHSGVAARVFKTLREANVDIQMISTSEIKISCLIDATQEKDAVQALHAEFCEKLPILT